MEYIKWKYSVGSGVQTLKQNIQKKSNCWILEPKLQNADISETSKLLHSYAIVAPFATLQLNLGSKKWSIIHSIISLFEKCFLSHLALELTKITFLMKIQTLFVEHIIDQYLLKRCQKKRSEQSFDIIKGFISKYRLVLVNCWPSKFPVGYFSRMKYLGLMLLTLSVCNFLFLYH